MKCPVCNIDLTMSERQGIEIDYCPKCRGVWLDRGELDKIVERSNGAMLNSIDRSTESKTSIPFPNTHNGDYYKNKKRKNFLDDIFDF